MAAFHEEVGLSQRYWAKARLETKFVKLWNLSQFCNERELHFAPTIANATSTPVRHRFGRWYGYFGNLRDSPPNCSDFDEPEGISGDEKRQTVGSRRSIKQCHHWWCRMRFMAALKEASLFNASPIHLMIRSPRSRRMTGQPSSAIRYVFRETVTQSANKNSINIDPRYENFLVDGRGGSRSVAFVEKIAVVRRRLERFS